MQDGVIVLYYVVCNVNFFVIKFLFWSNVDINVCDNVGCLYYNFFYLFYFYSRCKIILVILVQVEKFYFRFLDVYVEGIMFICMWQV